MGFIQIQLPLHILLLISRLPLSGKEKILLSVLLMNSSYNGQVSDLPEFIKPLMIDIPHLLKKLKTLGIILDYFLLENFIYLQYEKAIESYLFLDTEVISIRGKHFLEKEFVQNAL